MKTSNFVATKIYIQTIKLFLKIKDSFKFYLLLTTNTTSASANGNLLMIDLLLAGCFLSANYQHTAQRPARSAIRG